MSIFHKKKPSDCFPELALATKPKEKTLPYPVDKPHSCKSCENVYCGANVYCKINDKVVREYGAPPNWRTWDRCDKYSPYHICQTCKYYSPVIGIVMDEEFEDVQAGCTKGSTMGSGCWEAKE
jgi:hypothetical protein